MNKDRTLIAVVACRNNSSRLYGKPMQNLDSDSGWTILDQVIKNLKSLNIISQIVLAISEGEANFEFVTYAKTNNLTYVIGDEHDVLARILLGLNKVNGTDLFRVTSESPFLYLDAVNKLWSEHIRNNNDATFLDHIIDGCNFQIVTNKALKTSWENGSNKHRSEYIFAYIREFPQKFKLSVKSPPDELIRKDIRLTVDYPEDLIVCREIFKEFKNELLNSNYNINDFVKFIDSNKFLYRLIQPFVLDGYNKMYEYTGD